MRIVFFAHSLASDWNHGNAHFLRGVATELVERGHDVEVWEPRHGWSRSSLLAEWARRARARAVTYTPERMAAAYVDAYERVRGRDEVAAA